jgi:RHS repeat-associated protein
MTTRRHVAVAAVWLAALVALPAAHAEPRVPAAARRAAHDLATRVAPRRALAGARAGEALARMRKRLERLDRHLRQGAHETPDRAALRAAWRQAAAGMPEVARACARAKTRLRAAGLREKVAQVDRFLNGVKRDLRALRAAVRRLPRRAVPEAPMRDAVAAALALFPAPAADTGKAEDAARLRMRALAAAPFQAASPAPGPDDLAETPEVQFTPAITELAASLDGSPLRLYEHVRNRFAFEAYFGSLKGAQATLQSGAGNDWDLASLLIALLRVSGVPARYAFGTVQVPAATVTSWLGMAESGATEAGILLSTAGIPATPVAPPGGEPIAFRIQRAWVLAYVPFANYRGVPNATGGGAWVPLDPALKQRDLEAGIGGIAGSVPFVASACASPEPGYLCEKRPERPAEFYRDAVAGFLRDTMPGFGPADVPLAGPIVEETLGLLPASLPGTLVSDAEQLDEIPDVFRYHVAIALDGGDLLFAEVALPVPVDPSGVPAVLARKTIDWVPATPQDQATVDAFGGLADTPAFLVDVKPRFRVEGDVQVEGGATPLGTGVALDVLILFPDPDPLDAVDPQLDVVPHGALPAGEWVALGVDGNHVSPDYLADRAERIAAAHAARCASCADTCDDACATPVDEDELTGELLNLAVNLHFGRIHEGEDTILDLFHAKTVRQIFEGVTRARLGVTYLFDRPFAVTPEGLVMDIPHMVRGLLPSDGDHTHDLELAKLIGLESSAQEHATWEEVTGIESVSTVKFLQVAHAAGVRVFEDLTADDPILCQDDVTRPVLGCGAPVGCLEACGVSATMVEGMCADLASGRAITTPECRICPTCTAKLNQWQGTGWIAEDPATGAASFLIDGGLASAARSTSATGGLDPASPAAREIDAAEGERLLDGVPVEAFDADRLAALGVPAPARAHLQAFATAGFLVTWSPVVLEQDGHEVLVFRVEDPASGEVRWFVFDLTPSAGGGTTEDPPLPEGFMGNTGDGPGTAYTGDPVNIANGNLLRSEQDFSIPARGFPLAFERFYNSRLYRDSPLGFGWTHSFSDRMETGQDGSATWIDAHGGRYRFEPGPGDVLVPPAELHVVLTRDAAGYALRQRNGDVLEFNLAGQLVSMVDPNGNALTFAYDMGGLLTTVTDSAMRSLTFTYAAARLATVTDFTNRTWTYEHDGSRLTKVTSPSGPGTPAMVTRYEYYPGPVNTNLLRRVTEPNGGVHEYLYYADDRAFRVIDAEGGRESHFYGPFGNELRTVDPRGGETIQRHDEMGNLVALVHPDGATETWTYDDGKPASHTDPVGLTETWEYDANGDLVRYVDPAGVETTYEYDPVFGKLTRMERPGGRVTTNVYDANGNLMEAHDAEGGVRTVTYDAHGLPATVTDPRGHTTTFTYDASGQTLVRTTPLPSTETFTYDALGHTLTQSDGEGNTFTYGYDVLDRNTTLTDPEGHVTTFTYDAAGRLTQRTDPRGGIVRFEYDRQDRLLKTTDAEGGVTTSTWNAAGDLLSETDPAGNRTTWTYDVRGRLTETRFPDGGVVRNRYDAAGRMTSTRDGAGRTTRYQYGADGRLARTTDPLGGFVARTYDEVGNLATDTDPRGGVTTRQYDRLDRLVEVRAEGGRALTYDYDANGNTVAKTQYDVSGLAPGVDLGTLPPARRRERAQTFDVLNRIASETDPEGHTSTFEYDAAGNRITTTDARGKITRFEYDRDKRMTKVVQPDLGETLLEYDAANNRTKLTSPRGGVYTWAYDHLARVVSSTDPLAQTTTYAYSPIGGLVRRTNADGTWIAFGYDQRRRLQTSVRSDGEIARWVYDRVGNVLRAENDRTVVERSWDPLDRLASETVSLRDGTFDATVGYAYDAGSNITSITDPTGRVITYGWDDAGRLASIASTDGVSATFTYDGFGGQATATYGNGRTTTRSYDANGRPATIDHGAGVAQFAYTRDPLGHPLSVVESVGGTADTLSYTYDDRGWPASVTAAMNPGVRSETFAHDASGNLTVPGTGGPVVFDAAEQPASNGARTFTHDARGNQLAADDGATRLETAHDAEDRVTTVTRFAGGAPVDELEVVRDALDRPVELRRGASVRRIVHAETNRLLELDGDGNVLVAHVMGPQTDDAVAAVVGGAVRYLHRDEIGSVRAVTDGAGAVVGTRHYGAYGRPLATTGADGVPLGFTARPVDGPTGLVDMRARFYDPQAGRFLERDPARFTPFEPNPYTYAGNEPSLFVDPFGLTPRAVQAIQSEIEFLKRAEDEITGNLWYQLFGYGYTEYTRLVIRRAELEGKLPEWRQRIAKFQRTPQATYAAMFTESSVPGTAMRILGGSDPVTGHTIAGGDRILEGAFVVFTLAGPRIVGGAVDELAGLEPRPVRGRGVPKDPSYYGYGGVKEDDIWYGFDKNIGDYKRAYGGKKLLFEATEANPHYTDELSFNFLEESIKDGKRVRFIVDGIDDVPGILDGTSPYASNPTSAELRYVYQNRARLEPKIDFFKNHQKVPAPW